MWSVCDKRIKMVEKDYGIKLPIIIDGIEFSEGDRIDFIVENLDNQQIILTKSFDNFTDNTINLELTEEESNLLEPKIYQYRMDWYRDQVFMCNIILNSKFEVLKK